MYNYTCEKCGKGRVEAKLIRDHHARVKGREITISEANIGICNSCGAEYVGARELLRWQKIAEQSLLENLLTPAEVEGIRNCLGLSVGEFATFVGSTRQSIYNWERRDRVAPQIRPVDLLLKLIRESVREETIDVIEFLECEASKLGTPVRIRRRITSILSRCTKPYARPEADYDKLFGPATAQSRRFPGLTDFNTRQATVAR